MITIKPNWDTSKTCSFCTRTEPALVKVESTDPTRRTVAYLCTDCDDILTEAVVPPETRSRLIVPPRSWSIHVLMDEPTGLGRWDATLEDSETEERRKPANLRLTLTPDHKTTRGGTVWVCFDLGSDDREGGELWLFKNKKRAELEHQRAKDDPTRVDLSESIPYKLKSVTILR